VGVAVGTQLSSCPETCLNAREDELDALMTGCGGALEPGRSSVSRVSLLPRRSNAPTLTARTKCVADFRPSTLPGEEQRQKSRRPDEAMRENFRGRNALQEFPKNRNDAPRSERSDSRNQRGALFPRDVRR